MQEKQIARAHIKFVRVSPQKVRMLRDDVVRMSPDRALELLFITKTRAAKALYKAVKSAVYNAKQTLQTTPTELKFAVLKIDEGPAYKRFRAGGRGMAKPYKRRSSHIYVEVEKKSGITKVIKQAQEKTQAEPEVKIKQKTQKSVINMPTKA